MIEHPETFQLLAEIAVAVAGFAGVATVFGGQERAFNATEVARLRVLFQFSAEIFVCCLGLLAMGAAGLSSEFSVLCVSAFAALTNLCLVLDVPWKATKLRHESGASITPISLIVAFSPSVVFVPLLLFNAAYLRQEWLLIVAFSYFILISLWAFYRLLINRR